MRILVVDDEERLLELYKMSLESEGYEVITANSGIECGTQLFDNEDIDAIITDLSMPEQGGLKTIKYLRHGISERNKNMKIIVVSAFISDDVRKELEKLNTICFDKPVDMEAVFEALKK